MRSTDQHQLNALVWAVWGQGTRRLVWERPNGDVVSDLAERTWRVAALRVVPEADACPHWPSYRACAEPLVIKEARGRFPHEPADAALRQFFQQVQAGAGGFLVRAIAQHADLDRIVEADVWPWLERKSAAEEEVWRRPDRQENGESADAGGQEDRDVRASSAGFDYRDQIEPLARMAYRLDELGTQIAYLAEREISGVFGGRVQQTAVAESGVSVLASVSTIAGQQAAYVRSCAVSLHNTTTLAERISPSAVNESEQHQWWTDLTTRPITSKVRRAVSDIGSAEELAVMLRELAGESDVVADEMGTAFEKCGWTRGIVAGATVIGLELRGRADQITGG